MLRFIWFVMAISQVLVLQRQLVVGGEVFAYKIIALPN